MMKGYSFKLEGKWLRVERDISADKSRADEREIRVGEVNAKKLRKGYLGNNSARRKSR
jgi:hypothetical protein